MRTFAQKPKGTQQTTSSEFTKAGRPFLAHGRRELSALHSSPSHAIGNQAVQRLIQTEQENIDARSAVTHDVNHVPAYPGTLTAIQPKMMVNPPNDRYEQEADRIAYEVMHQKTPKEKAEKAGVQAKISQQGGGGVREVNKETESQLSRSKGSGNPISDPVRAVVEPRLQYDFSKVRIHTDSEAARMNKTLGARAFTHGDDIYFGKGQYQPQSTEGLGLIAHEMTHVVQQSQGPVSNSVQRVLNHEAREIMKDKIIDEMNTAHTDFDVGAVQVERDITAAARAEAGAAKVIFGIGMSLIVPGFGGVVSRIAAPFGVTIAENTARLIGGAIGVAAKSAGNSAIDQTYSRNPRRFFSAITSGFEAAQRSKRNWLRENVNNHSALPDNVLQDLEQYWTQLASNNESADWATWFRVQWVRFQAQVGAIGPHGTGLVSYGPVPLSNDNIPARIRLENGETRLALVNKTRVDFTNTWEFIRGESDIRTRYRYLTWIDEDLAGVAISQVSSVPTLNESRVSEMPD